jgi:hypothetical protein
VCRADEVRQTEADNHGNRRNDEGITERFQPDAAEIANIADARDADDQGRENERHDDHQKQIQKQLADRPREVFDRPDDIRIVAAERPVDEQSADDADEQTDQNLGVQRHAFRPVGRFVVEIGSQFLLVIVIVGVAFVFFVHNF